MYQGAGRNLPQQVAAAQTAMAVAGLPPNVIKAIQANYDQNQIVVQNTPYYSTVRLQATRAAGPPVILSIDTSARRAFAYAIGMSLVGAGFLSAYGNATEADTNLLSQSQTRDNADFWLYGLACSISPDSEPTLAQQVWRNSDIQMSLNGNQNIPLGTLNMYPGAGGLYGAAQTFTRIPAIDEQGPANGGVGGSIPFFSNGHPFAKDYFEFQNPWKWSGIGTAGADSSLVMTVTPRRTCAVTCGLARAAATGILAFDPPAAAGDQGTYVDVQLRLIGVSVAKRSVNV